MFRISISRPSSPRMRQDLNEIPASREGQREPQDEGDDDFQAHLFSVTPMPWCGVCRMRRPPHFGVGFPTLFPSRASPSPYSSDMDYAENSKERLKNLWRTKVEAAELRYSRNPSIDPRGPIEALKTFVDLVLRGKAAQPSGVVASRKARIWASCNAIISRAASVYRSIRDKSASARANSQFKPHRL